MPGKFDLIQAWERDVHILETKYEGPSPEQITKDGNLYFKNPRKGGINF